MVLKLTVDEMEIMKKALDQYCKALRTEARPHCAGRSALGIELCIQRINAETLLEQLNQPLPLPEPIRLEAVPAREFVPMAAEQAA